MGWQQIPDSASGSGSGSGSDISRTEVAQRVKDANIEIVAHSYERGRAYTNILILGGYAGGFAVWNFSRPVLSNRATVWIALLFLVSLATFVLFEVYQMVVLTRVWMANRAILTADVPPEEFLRRHDTYRKAVNKQTVSALLAVWVVALYVTLATALAALALLLYSFISTLTGLPAWP